MNMRLPEYLPTGVFDSKFLSDLQNRIPSVVVYFWNLNNCENRDKTCLTYINMFKSNEKALKPWGIQAFTVICYDQLAQNFGQPNEIETSMRDTVSTNKFFLRDIRDLEDLLTEWKYS